MVIHSVTHRFLLGEDTNLPGFIVRETPFGHLTGLDTPEGFRIARIHSTNPADYLNEAYSPGCIYRG